MKRKEIELPAREFMGYTVQRSQLKLGDREFTPLPTPPGWVSDRDQRVAPVRHADSSVLVDRSAHDSSIETRSVPLITLSLPPPFFLDDAVSAALENSIDAIAGLGINSTTGHATLANLTHRLCQVSRHTYRPDDEFEKGNVRGDLLRRYHLPIGGEPDQVFRTHLAIRPEFGVYHAQGREWLGLFLYAVVVPGTQLRGPTGMARLHHEGVEAPQSTAFDMIVPVEPEIVTSEWGWGAELPGVVHNTRHHLHHPDALQLRAAVERAQNHRDRAIQTLRRHGWKALLVAVVECLQLTLQGETE